MKELENCINLFVYFLAYFWTAWHNSRKIVRMESVEKKELLFIKTKAEPWLVGFTLNPFSFCLFFSANHDSGFISNNRSFSVQSILTILLDKCQTKIFKKSISKGEFWEVKLYSVKPMTFWEVFWKLFRTCRVNKMQYCHAENAYFIKAVLSHINLKAVSHPANSSGLP